MKTVAVAGLALFLSGNVLAEILEQSEIDFKCERTGGFFDFSPANAIAGCKEEIEEFCKAKKAPPLIGKVTGVPSGFGVYARAEIRFQCASAEDVAQRQKAMAEAQSQQIKTDVEASKKICQDDFGFKPGTPEFGGCLMEMQKQLFANRRADKDRAVLNEIAEEQLAQQRKADAERAAAGAIQSIQRATTPRPPSRTNCTTYGTNTNCTTW